MRGFGGKKGNGEMMQLKVPKRKEKEREGSKYSLNTEIRERFTNPPRDFQHQ